MSLDYQLLPKSAIFLPLIGWLVGGITALAFYLSDLCLPQTSAIILSVICGVFITGGFHEDGFADVCDGFGGGWDKPQILNIMKDSQIGTYGALGLILILLLKISLLSAHQPGSIPLLLIASHSLSRLAPLLVMFRYDYARSEISKSSAAVFKPKIRHLCFACTIALLPFLLLSFQSLLSVIPVLIANWLFGRYCFRHIGGYTGDCLGASQQISETVFYVSITAIWTSI